MSAGVQSSFCYKQSGVNNHLMTSVSKQVYIYVFVHVFYIYQNNESLSYKADIQKVSKVLLPLFSSGSPVGSVFVKAETYYYLHLTNWYHFALFIQ